MCRPTNQVPPRSTATRRSRATLAQANSGLEPCRPACTSNPHWKNLLLCGAGRHEPRNPRVLRPAVPIHGPASNCLWHPTTRPARAKLNWPGGSSDSREWRNSCKVMRNRLTRFCLYPLRRTPANSWWPLFRPKQSDGALHISASDDGDLHL